MKTQTLIQILRKEQSLHEKLLLTKREEKRYLAIGDTQSLLKTSEQISDFASEAHQLEEQRMQCTRDLAQSLGLDKPNPTLSEILPALSEDQRVELDEARADLKNTISEVIQINQENTLVLQRSVETLNSRVAQSLQQQESGVYSQTGNKPSHPARRSNFNLQA